MTVIEVSAGSDLGITAGDSAAATATCPAGTVVVGGGGLATQHSPQSAALTMAWPRQDPERFTVSYTRMFDVEASEFGTLIFAYAICAKIDTTE